MRPRTLPLPLALVLFLGCAASHGLDPDADAGLDVAPPDAPRSDWPFELVAELPLGLGPSRVGSRSDLVGRARDVCLSATGAGEEVTPGFAPAPGEPFILCADSGGVTAVRVMASGPEASRMELALAASPDSDTLFVQSGSAEGTLPTVFRRLDQRLAEEHAVEHAELRQFVAALSMHRGWVLANGRTWDPSAGAADTTGLWVIDPSSLEVVHQFPDEEVSFSIYEPPNAAHGVAYMRVCHGMICGLRRFTLPDGPVLDGPAAPTELARFPTSELATVWPAFVIEEGATTTIGWGYFAAAAAYSFWYDLVLDPPLTLTASSGISGRAGVVAGVATVGSHIVVLTEVRLVLIDPATRACLGLDESDGPITEGCPGPLLRPYSAALAVTGTGLIAVQYWDGEDMTLRFYRIVA